jgi:hypothetical protein
VGASVPLVHSRKSSQTTWGEPPSAVRRSEAPHVDVGKNLASSARPGQPGEAVPTWLVRCRTSEGTRAYIAEARNNGRVRQVGPPPPLTQSSEPGKVRTSNPTSRSLSLVC